MTATLTDLFCGAGGSALGATAVDDVELTIAANHWATAVETHAANFPRADHDCADISQVDPRRYPTTDLLWASPECTNHSVAKGRRRAGGPDLFDGVGGAGAAVDEGAERSRATMWDVPRFAEHHRYRGIVVENVVDAARWVLWPAWLHAMSCLGYRHRVVYLNSMHAPAAVAPRAPQSRDRLYVVFWRSGARAPDLDVRPHAWCAPCGAAVGAVQWWKRPDRPWGRYRAQYLYRCPGCHAVVEPEVLPAAAVIDWSLPGQRIGDRDKPLSPKTLARIDAGLRRYAGAMTFEARGNTYARIGPDGQPNYARAWPVDRPTATLTTTETRALVVPVEGRDSTTARPAGQPLRTQTTRLQDALVVPSGGTWNDDARPASESFRARTTRETDGVAFIAELRGGGSVARDVAEPLATVTASGNHHMLVRHNTARGDAGQMCTPTTEPARTITTAGHQSLVGWPTAHPTTHEAALPDGRLAALPAVLPAVEDCSFRMLEPAEIQAAMAFSPGYQVLGTRRERVRQLGNAVTPPAAEFLIRALLDALAAGGRR